MGQSECSNFKIGLLHPGTFVSCNNNKYNYLVPWWLLTIPSPYKVYYKERPADKTAPVATLGQRLPLKLMSDLVTIYWQRTDCS